MQSTDEPRTKESSRDVLKQNRPQVSRSFGEPLNRTVEGPRRERAEDLYRRHLCLRAEEGLHWAAYRRRQAERKTEVPSTHES